MEGVKALLKADEVKTFPSIIMNKPNSKISTEVPQAIKLEERKKFVARPSRVKKSKLPSISDSASLLRGSLKATVAGYKPPVINRPVHQFSGIERNIMVGQNTANLSLDGTERDHLFPAQLLQSKSTNLMQRPKYTNKEITFSDFLNDNSDRVEDATTSDDLIKTFPTSSSLGDLRDRSHTSKAPSRKSDNVMNELRKYLSLMDEYSLHNFIIYNGHTLKDTPEYSNFKKTFQHSWGAMVYIIHQLEQFTMKFNVKMAVIDGSKVYKLAQLNAAYYEKADLMSCIANSDQLKPQLSAASSDGGINQLNYAVIRIQTLVRRFLAQKKFSILRKRFMAIVKIQSHYRRRRYRLLIVKLVKSNRAILDDKWKINSETLKEWWKTVPDTIPNQHYEANQSKEEIIPPIIQTLSDFESASLDSDNRSDQQSKDTEVINSQEMKDRQIIRNIMGFRRTSRRFTVMTKSRKRLIIIIPSIASPEYLRLSMIDSLHVYQNSHISSVLYLLVDPDVHLVYVSPVKFTLADLHYHESQMKLLGINCLPGRFHIIVPELIDKLPGHLSLAQILLCSTGALNKIRYFMKKTPNAMILPTNVSWAEKRLVDFLNIPMLSPEPMTAVTLQSKSFIKKLFMESLVNIPIGAHDIFSEEDFLIGLSRLISTNLDINRWIFRLNYDYNNESVAYLDVNKLSVISSLKKEQTKLLNENKTNHSSWYSRPVQFSVRQRVIQSLRNELSKRVVICSPNIYNSWEIYMNLVNSYGVVIEAEPIEKLGYVDGLCFIDPVDGNINFFGGSEVILDDHYKSQAVIIPQSITPLKALENATLSIASALNKKYNLIGHTSIRFVSSWDGLDNIPRLAAIGIQVGITTSFHSYSFACVVNNKSVSIPKCLIPYEFPQGLNVLTIPIAFHRPLKGAKDEIFFKLSRMKGVSFDINCKTGTIFHLVDSVIGGHISITSISSTRRKTIQLAVFALDFIVQQHGKATVDEATEWNQVTAIGNRLKALLKSETD